MTTYKSKKATKDGRQYFLGLNIKIFMEFHMIILLVSLKKKKKLKMKKLYIELR